MIRRPPRSTRTDTLFPYTTLFRSHGRTSLALPDRLARAVESHSLRPRQWAVRALPSPAWRSEEHTSELQSLMRISYAVFCLKKKNKKKKQKMRDIQTTVSRTNRPTNTNHCTSDTDIISINH